MPKGKSAAPHAGLLGKDANFKQVAYADWIEAQTGYAVDLKSVQLALSLVGPWRKSDELAALKKSHVPVRELNKKAAAERKRERAASKAAKLRAELAALESEFTPASTGTPEPVAATAPAKKAAAKKAPAKAAAKKTGKPKAAKKAPESNVTPIEAAKSTKGTKTKAASSVDDDDF